MLKTKKVAVIGTGNIGTALIGGMLRGKLIAPKSITASDLRREQLGRIQKEWGVRTACDNAAAVRGADIVILAVKPQGAEGVLKGLAGKLGPERLVISVMAGIPTSRIEERLGKPVPVVRAMPNTPARIDQGATAIAAGRHAAKGHLKLAESVFGAVGRVETVAEDLMDAVTGLSGTGPVYVFMVIEALTDAGVKMGIPRDAASRLAAQTVKGAAQLAQETGQHPALLKDEVTTPGGTAIAAVHELEAKGLRNVLIDAVVTATKRSEELSKLFG